MIPAVEQVMNRRAIVRTIIRATGGVLLLIGIVPLGEAMVSDLLQGDLLRLLRYYPSRHSEDVSLLVLMVGLAGTVWALQGRIVRWLVPWPGSGRCPQCNYRLERLASPRCPECGCDLPAALVQSRDGEPRSGS